MSSLISKTIKMRLVEEHDAEFILSLRLDEKYSTYLTKVESDLDRQKSWIKEYKKSEQEKKQFYFIIERLDGCACGTVRLYDFREHSFSWGSWILNQDKTRYSAIESALMVYKYGFDYLGFMKSHFEVMKGNEKVVAFHEKMGARRVGEDEVNFYFEINKPQIDIVRANFIGKIL